MLRASKNVLLLEPPYARNDMPLGLAKIASFLRENTRARVKFRRNYDTEKYDLICTTSLFTYDLHIIFDVLNNIRKGFFADKNVPILLGGIAASIITKKFENYENLFIFKGYSRKLDLYIPDYSINWKLEAPWDDMSYTFTTRGCPNNCGYCVVKRLEKEPWINPKWRDHLSVSIKYITISDNNLSAMPIEHVNNVLEFLRILGKPVIFNSGFDVKYITKDMAERLGKLKFTRRGMRVAFDRIEEDIIFQKVVQLLLDSGVSNGNIMAYVLFNFNDTPGEAAYRAEECWKLDILPYPQRYVPLTHTNRKFIYVGKYWTESLAAFFRSIGNAHAMMYKLKTMKRALTADITIPMRKSLGVKQKDIDLYMESRRTFDKQRKDKSK